VAMATLPARAPDTVAPPATVPESPASAPAPTVMAAKVAAPDAQPVLAERPAPLAKPAKAPTPAALRSSSAAPATAGPVLSTVPKSPIPIPRLAQAYRVADREGLAHVCRSVEAAVIAAGVSPEFARGITARMQRAAEPGTTIYPSAMYYFVVREAGLRHDQQTAAANLAAQFRDLAGFRQLPAWRP
jgi:hypothetical protein